MSAYENNYRKVLNDYYLCLGAFENCKTLYENSDMFSYKDYDSTEEKEIKKGRKEDLLSNLGKVCEKALKYILGLELLKITPNLDDSNFEAFFKKNKVDTIKEFARHHGIETINYEVLNIFNDKNNPKSHNFNYWFSIFELIMKDDFLKFKKFIEYSSQSTMLLNYCIKNNKIKWQYSIDDGTAYDGEYEEWLNVFQCVFFPTYIGTGDEPRISEDKVKIIFDAKREAIRKSGDIFNRFRYASNNTENKDFNIEEIFTVIKDIVEYIKLIHMSKDNLGFDLDIKFAHKKALENKELLEMTEEEINKIFDLPLSHYELMRILFRYDYDYIKRLLDIGVKVEDLDIVLENGLTPSNIKYFNSKGITDYDQMRNYLDEYVNNLNKYHI